MKVGSGITTFVPLATVTTSSAAIISFEPLPARMPSAPQPDTRASAWSSSFGSNAG